MVFKSTVRNAGTPSALPVPIAEGGTAATTNRGAAANLRVPYILGMSGVAAPVTGTASETALATITIPAGAMGPNGMVRITTFWDYTNSGNNKTLRVRFGGIGGTAYASNIYTTTAGIKDMREIHNRNSASSQVGGPSNTNGSFTGVAGNCITSTVDTTASVDIVITGQLANTGETITLNGYLVELLYGA